MNAKKSKKVLLLASLSTLAVSTAAVMAISFNSEAAKVRGLGEVVNGTISWNAGSSKTVHGANRVSYISKTDSGTSIVLYSYGQYDLSGDYILDSKASDSMKFGLFVDTQEGNTSPLFSFQGITSVKIVTSASSDEGAGFGIYTSNDSEGTPVYTQTAGGVEDQEFVVTTEVNGAHYLAVRPTTKTLEIIIKSITVTYSCEAGGGPVVNEYNISYYGMNSSYDLIPLAGIDESSLVSKAAEGSEVTFLPVALDGYTYLGGFGMEDSPVEDVYSDDDGRFTFVMPSQDVAFVLFVSVPVVLESITLDTSNVATEFTVGDTFSSSGLVVTANYSDGSSAVVATGDLTITGYDMSTASVQTVTVSYTEDEVTKTSSYQITVTSKSIPVTITGVYNFSSRSKSGNNYPDWPNMKITFNSDGTATWENHRSNYLGKIDCECFFTYTAIDNGANISINMALTGYYFERAGAVWDSASAWSGYGYDRPVDAGFTVSTAKNNSGVMALDRSSMTINVFDKDHSYKVYDTFTFVLAA